MSYSPQVLPARGRSLGDDLADAVLAFAQGMRQKKADDLATQDRDRRIHREDEQDTRAREQAGRQRVLDAISLYQSGYREGPPPEAAPASDLADMIAAQRGNRLQSGPGVMADAPPPVAPPGPDTGGDLADLVAGLARGNRTQADYGAPSGPPPMTQGNLTQGMVPGPRPASGGALPQPVGPGADATAGPGALAGTGGTYHPTNPTPPAGPSLIRQVGSQFYQRVPGTSGYIDPEATPEARRRREAVEDDRRRQQQALELEDRRALHGREDDERTHGYRVAETDRDFEQRRALERDRRTYDAAEARRRQELRTRGVGLTAGEEADEAEGQAILSELVGRGVPAERGELAVAFGQAFQSARRENPAMTPGRLANGVLAGLRRTRPDLFTSHEAKDAPGDDLAALLASLGITTETNTTPGGQPAQPFKNGLTTDQEISTPRRRVITPDQRDYLEAIGRWNPALYAVTEDSVGR